MKVFIAANPGETETDALNNSITMIRKAKEYFGDDIEIKTPYTSGYYPPQRDHYLYSLGKSIEIMSQCDYALFPESTANWLIRELEGIWRRRRV